jgi:hypothetical protein
MGNERSQRLRPSRVRDQLENRVRKVAGSYSVGERIKAPAEIERIAGEYRGQLEAELDPGDCQVHHYEGE